MTGHIRYLAGHQQQHTTIHMMHHNITIVIVIIHSVLTQPQESH
jgi:hypothetical protein